MNKISFTFDGTQFRTAKRRAVMAVMSVRILVFLFLAFAFAGAASAESILLSDAVVHTVSGKTLPRGSVLVQDGKIKGVFENAKPDASLYPADATVIDLKGQHLYPGLIALDSALGLNEIEAVRATLDLTEVSEFHPDVESWIAVNPDSELLPVTRANGIAYFEPAPQGGVVAGTSGVMALDGWTTEQMTIKRPAALHVYWPAMELNTTPKELVRDKASYKSLADQAKERQAKVKEIEDFFLEARAYAKGRAAAPKSGPDHAINPPWEAMLPVVRGEIPIMVHASELRQIKSAVKWAQTNDFKIIIVGGRDAWEAADLLAAQKIPVIYEFTFAEPARDYNPYDVYFKAPEVLRKVGVTVAFSSGPSTTEAPISKNLPYHAAQCVAFGFPKEEALKGMTLYPAQLLGVADRVGTIEPGKEASLFVCDGDIFDIRANVKRAWINGREISLENRHTRLYEKYKNRPRSGQ